MILKVACVHLHSLAVLSLPRSSVVWLSCSISLQHFIFNNLSFAILLLRGQETRRNHSFSTGISVFLSFLFSCFLLSLSAFLCFTDFSVFVNLGILHYLLPLGRLSKFLVTLALHLHCCLLPFHNQSMCCFHLA